MYDLKHAIAQIKINMPYGNVKAYAELNTKFVFLVMDDDPLEGDFDPYYSIDKNTGVMHGFSMFTDEPINSMSPIPNNLV